MFISDTIVAPATGLNASGIGIIRISGSDSFRIIEKIFRTKAGKKLENIESHRVYYGYIYNGDILVDEVLIIPMKSPKSYTMEDTIEIDCHGGSFVLDNILKLAIKNGARVAEPGEFTKRAFLNGRIDLSEAESVIDVINSKNNYALNNSLKQLTGSLYDQIQEIRDELLNEIAFIEAALDDPEHISLDSYYEEVSEKIDRIYIKLEHLYKSFKNGRIIKEGIKTVIIGKPNVGKSSLLNYLSGYDKAIVTDIPGTTRDVIEECVRLNELTLIVCDTAGIRNSEDPVEKIGVEKAKSVADDSDLIIFVIDSSIPIDQNDIKIFDYIKDKKAVILLNKSDLPTVNSEDYIKKLNYDLKPIISVSAKDGSGFDELYEVIKDMFLSGNNSYNDEMVITNERHSSLLYKSIESLDNLKQSIEKNMPEDCLSIDLIDCYDLLGMIIGEKIEDNIINEIFSKFCVGK